MTVLVGIFVGGRARRMGGIAKGLLVAPGGDEPIVSRLARLAREAYPSSRVVLVGDNAAYAGLGLQALADAPMGVGPLGGLCALLDAADRERAGAAVALACDLPFVSGALLARLSAERLDADALAPRPGGVWQPLFARYAPGPASIAGRAALEAGERSLYRVLERLGERTAELELSPEEEAALTDWDEPVG